MGIRWLVEGVEGSIEELGGLASFVVEVGERTAFAVEVYVVPAGHDAAGEDDAVIVDVRRVRPVDVVSAVPGGKVHKKLKAPRREGVGPVAVEPVESLDGLAAVFHIPPGVGVLKVHPTVKGATYCPRVFCDGGLQHVQGECPQCVDRIERGLPLPNPYAGVAGKPVKRRVKL